MLDSLLHPPNFDDWEWSTSRDYSFIKKWLPKKKKCYNHNFSRPINKVWFLILFFSAGISTSFADWPRFCYKNTSSLRWKSKHSIELKTEAWKPETEQNFFSRYTTYITIYSAYMILRSIWTVFKNAILHTNEVSKISPATKSLLCSDLLLVFVEAY